MPFPVELLRFFAGASEPDHSSEPTSTQMPAAKPHPNGHAQQPARAGQRHDFPLPD